MSTSKPKYKTITLFWFSGILVKYLYFPGFQLQQQNRGSINFNQLWTKTFQMEVIYTQFKLESTYTCTCLTGILGKGKGNGKVSSWQSIITGCGSNAFCQLNLDGYELMTSTLKLVSIPANMDAAAEYIDNIACGTNISCVTSGTGSKALSYLWGSGLPGSSIRVPTALSVKGVIKVRDVLIVPFSSQNDIESPMIVCKEFHQPVCITL